jgi:hypothetical protein
LWKNLKETDHLKELSVDGRVTCDTIGEKKNAYRLLMDKPEGNNHLKELSVDGRVTCDTIGEKKNAYRLLMDKPEGNRPLARSRRKWESNNRNN